MEIVLSASDNWCPARYQIKKFQALVAVFIEEMVASFQKERILSALL